VRAVASRVLSPRHVKLSVGGAAAGSTTLQRVRVVKVKGLALTLALTLALNLALAPTLALTLTLAPTLTRSRPSGRP
jgi:hypothetical protein